MTHAYSASDMKSGRRNPASRDVPRPGTKTRKLYDLLMDNAGKWVTIFKDDWDNKNFPATLQMMSLTYGLDIRTKRVPHSMGWGMIDVLLAGEYVNSAYLDYVVNPELAVRGVK
jgi:hypothetical protein